MTTNEATTIKMNEGATGMQKNDKVIQMKRDGISNDTSNRRGAVVEVIKLLRNTQNADENYLLCKLSVDIDPIPLILIHHDGQDINVNDLLFCTLEYKFSTERGYHYQLIELHYNSLSAFR